MNSDFPKIRELKQDEAWPERQSDFHVVGDREAVLQACASDYACCQCWDYIIDESSTFPGIWLVWQEEKGGTEA